MGNFSEKCIDCFGGRTGDLENSLEVRVLENMLFNEKDANCEHNVCFKKQRRISK